MEKSVDLMGDGINEIVTGAGKITENKTKFFKLKSLSLHNDNELSL